LGLGPWDFRRLPCAKALGLIELEIYNSSIRREEDKKRRGD